MKSFLCFFFLILANFLFAFDYIGEITCLNENNIPASMDLLIISVNEEGMVQISNSGISIILNAGERQQLIDFLKTCKSFFETVNSETIEIQYGGLVGQIDTGNDQLSVYFSTDGKLKNTKIYIKIIIRLLDEKLIKKSSLYSLNKENCDLFIDILEQAEKKFQNLLWQKSLFISQDKVSE
jgi:hypothetical protein